MGISLNPGTLLNGQGIDVNALVTQSLAPANAQVASLQQQQQTLQQQSGLLGSINSDLSNLSSAVNSLNDALGPLNALSGQSSQSSILTASAQSGATPGTHTVVVNTLATQGTVYSDPVATADTSILPSGAGGASISFQVGGSSGPTNTVNISAGTNDTLNKVVSFINSQNWGVTATVLNDSTGARLAIFSNNTGSSGAVAITSNTSALTFNPPVGGTDATFTVDGIPFSNSSNTVSGALPGVTLNLLGAFPGIQVQVSVAADASQAAQAINSFVTAYNTVIGDLNTQFTVNPATNSEGPLGSDGTLRSLQSSLLSDATYSPGAGALANLSSLGITMNDDGTLTVDASQLQSALSGNPSDVSNFFQNSTQTGFANAFANDLQNLTDPTQGVINLDLQQNQNQQQTLSNSINDLQGQISTQQQQLQTEFSQVNALLESFPFQLQSVQLELGITPPNSTNGQTL